MRARKVGLGIVLAVSILPILAGCPSPGPVTPIPDADAAPYVEPDAGAPPALDSATSDDCARAEAVLVALACKDSRGQPLSVNKHGVPFAATCRDLAANRVDVHPACIARATSCPAVFSCSL